MKTLLSYLLPLRRRMLTGFCIKVTGTVAELLLPLILTHILNNVIGTLQVGRVVLYGGVMILCAAAACVLNIVANRMATGVATDFSREMRRQLFAKTLYLSAADSDRFTIPSLEARLTSDTYNVHHFVAMMQRMGVRSPILLIGGILLSFVLDPALALVMLAMVPFIFAAVLFVRRKGVPLYGQVQSSVDAMVRVVREDVQGIRVIKALSKGDYENQRYDAVNLALSRQECRAGAVMGGVNPLMTLLMNLGIAAVVGLSAVRVAQGKSSPATVIAFMQYFTQISMAMMTLSRIFVMYTKCAASARRIAQVLDTPDRYFVTEWAGQADPAAPHIAFDEVRFSYLGKQPDLEDVSFALPRGGQLGIIGATGSGKSTLIKLLLRFYEPDAGSIRIGGRPLTSYPRSELTALFGAALQNDFLYADTIAENIRFGRDIPDDEVRRAARIAQAEEFILAQPDGYDHLLAPKGTNLSGGQRQRLLIARAIAARPQILILDDSSSALDYRTDAALRRALQAELAGCTVVTVAQRVSSVKHCDLILVLDEGRIIGRGTHSQLLTDCPAYREISESQMGGAFVD